MWKIIHYINCTFFFFWQKIAVASTQHLTRCSYSVSFIVYLDTAAVMTDADFLIATVPGDAIKETLFIISQSQNYDNLGTYYHGWNVFSKAP